MADDKLVVNEETNLPDVPDPTNLPDLPLANKIPEIFSRIKQVQTKPFKVIDNDKLEKISEMLEPVNEKIHFLANRDTQTTRKLMTLQMLQPAGSTYRVLRQVLAQIEDRQGAISENYGRMKQTYAEILKLQKQLENEDDPLERMLLEGMIEEKKAGLANSIAYLENAIKEVGYLLDAYEQIKESKNIPDEWDEEDVEREEIKAHIRSAFRNAVRDILVHGRIGMGTVEYMEQFGISPLEAFHHASKYIDECNHILASGSLPDYDHFMNFLDEMAETYKDSYKKACKRLGISELYTREFLYMAENKFSEKSP